MSRGLPSSHHLFIDQCSNLINIIIALCPTIVMGYFGWNFQRQHRCCVAPFFFRPIGFTTSHKIISTTRTQLLANALNNNNNLRYIDVADNVITVNGRLAFLRAYPAKTNSSMLLFLTVFQPISSRRYY